MNVALHSIELCAGIGMLGEGVRAAFDYLGIEHRTVCYVEREASAAGQLVALMETGALDAAPVWSDLVTFDGAAWRGHVHCVIAGFPCQDLSVAGRRAGLDGKRSGLFFNVLDIADACGAELLVLENVSGITSATAAVVDEAEGELFERAAARVMGELADRGWDAECLLIRASDVGANHERARWFCIAWRMAHDGLQYGDIQQRKVRPEHSGAGDKLGNARRECTRTDESQRLAKCGCASDIGACGCELGDLESQRDGSRCLSVRDCAPITRATDPGLNVGHSDSARSQGRRELVGERRSERTAWPSGVDDIFAPGPLDDRWPGIVTHRPDLAPATEPGVRMLADGMAYLVDESRNHQLRQAGNGVVALQAAVAVVTLARRAGIF